MMASPSEWLDLRGGSLRLDPQTGGLTGAVLAESGLEFVADPKQADATPAGLLRIALPVHGYGSHYLEAGVHGRPEIVRSGETLRLVYAMRSEHATAPIRAEIELRPAPEGLVLRASVHNGGSIPIPQVAFPQLLGLAASGGGEDTRLGFRASPAGHPPRVWAEGSDETRLRLSRGTLWPLHQLALRPDDGSFMETPLQRYFGYGAFEFSMKWLDYGDSRGGITLYSRDPRYTTQGLLVERPNREEPAFNLRWLHYPTIDPGETWDSGDFVLLLHPGDWHKGAAAFREFAEDAYPSNAPQHIREALGIRTVWPRPRHAPPNFPISELPAYAEEIADPELGLAELSVWHWWEKNGLPIFLDPLLGTQDELRGAIARCRELGVPISLFVSHHLLRDTDESPDAWKHLNAAGQPVQDDWTYGRDFLPKWHVPFMGTHAMVRGSLLAPGFREAIVKEYAQMLELGATSICFDQFWAWYEPNYNPAADGAPDQEGDRLLELGRILHAMIHEADPKGMLAGEMLTEQKVPILDYTWEWRNSIDLDEDAPFRYVFPHVRLNANVTEHPRGALLGFADGGLLNLMPGQMHSYRLADCPELVETVRQLAALRRRFLRYFVEGRYHHVEGLVAKGCHARLYRHGEDVLVVVLNPTDRDVQATVEVDPASWGGEPLRVAPTVIGLDGLNNQGWDGARFSDTLGPDQLRVLEFATGGSNS